MSKEKLTPSPAGTQTSVNEMAGIMKEENVAPVPEAAKPKMVEVDANVLQNLMDRLADVESKAGEFEKTASQDQIRKIEALRAQGKLVKSVKIRRFNGKFVLAWAVTEDNVWVADGKVYEVQKLDIFFEDGTKENITLAQFTRGAMYETYEVLKEARTADGNIEYTLILPGGKNLVIMEKYVN